MRRFALALPCLLAIAGCHARTAADDRKEYCDDNYTDVELIPGGVEPNRPYQIVSVVDATWFPTPERRARTMQIKACRLHADAVIDNTEATTTVEQRDVTDRWGRIISTRTETTNPNLTPGKGYAIRWVNGSTSAAAGQAKALPPSPPAPPGPPAPPPVGRPPAELPPLAPSSLR